MPRRRSPALPPPPPWTPEEDARLVKVCAIGLSVEFWPTALPGRRFGDIAARRLDLRPRMAPLL